MFNWFKRWRENSRAWSHGQSVVWPKFLAVDANGLTQFQHEAVEQLVAAIGPVQLEKVGTRETYLTGKLTGTEAIVFIYPDGAQIHGKPGVIFMAEREDHATPQDLLQQFVASARAASAT